MEKFDQDRPNAHAPVIGPRDEGELASEEAARTEIERIWNGRNGATIPQPIDIFGERGGNQ